MRERDRLRDLKMRKTGHHRRGVLLRNVEQGALQRANERPDVVDLRAEVQPDVGRHLVVAGARRVQAFARVADEIGQAPLDIQVHVLEVDRPFENAALDLVPDLREASLDRLQIDFREDAARMQHARVRDRPVDVERRKTPVESDRRGEALYEIADRLVETA